MKVKNKITLILLLLLTFFFIVNVKSYAGYQSWNSLKYDATLNSDGSMDVVETWNISISETNTVFKDFVIDYSKYSGIYNVAVSEMEYGEETFLTQIFEEQYHVDEGCFYALPISADKFEIAWNVGLDNGSGVKIYKIYYTIENAVKKYNDCAELYWQFLGTDNEIPGSGVNGIIHLPNDGVRDLDKLRVWAHGDLSGNIEKTSNDTVSFYIPKLDTGTMIEVRVVTEEDIFDDCLNVINRNKLEEILEEEQRWADEANARRERIENIKYAVIYGVIGINALAALIFLLKIIKYLDIYKEFKNSRDYEKIDITYFRDIPDEKNATPARALYLYNYSNRNGYKIPGASVISATMLDLSLKGLLEFEPIDNKNIRITLKNKEKCPELTRDEQIIFQMLDAIKKEENSFTTEDLEKYAKKHYEKYMNLSQRIGVVVDGDMKNSNKINMSNSLKVKDLKVNLNTYIGLIVVFVFGCWFIPTAILGSVICALIINKTIKLIDVLTEEGSRQKAEWHGLKKFMEDYSLLKEKEVPDIVLWEKFLVYATAFGISKKVIKELKVVHPEMFNNMNSRDYGYWNVVCSPYYGNNGFDILSDNINRAYSKANSAYNMAHSSSSSSGSGGGGGFSGGGGGRRRRRRLRRSLE